MIWQPEEEEILKAMAAEGHSASQIAKALIGRTRNAVIGKCSRLSITLGRKK